MLQTQSMQYCNWQWGTLYDGNKLKKKNGFTINISKQRCLSSLLLIEKLNVELEL